MKKFDKIYLDMDGVIADFNGLFKKLISGGMEPHEYEEKYGTIAFWDAILEHQDFFTDISAFPHIYDLIDRCYEMSDKVVILSSPSKFNTSICIQQKRAWLNDQGCEDLPAIFEKEKYKFARPNCLLIDDYDSNIEKWLQAGGEAHHFKDYATFKAFYNAWSNDGNQADPS